MEEVDIIVTQKHILLHPKRPIQIPNLLTYFSNTLILKNEHRWGGYFLPELFGSTKRVGVLLDASSSSSLKSFTELPTLKLVNIVLDPSSISPYETNLIELDYNGVMRPYNLPDISNLAMTPMPVKLFFMWLLQNATPATIHKVFEVVMAGTSAQLPVVREEYEMQNGVHDVFVRSYSNYLKIIYLYSEFTDFVSVDASINQLTSDARDGRELSLHMVAQRRVEGRKKRVRISNPHAHISLVVWNCRGIARSAFPTIFAHIIDLHNPEFIILSETRVSNFISTIILPNKLCKVYSANPKNLGGGIAVVALSKAVRVHVSDVDENKWSGTLQLN